MCKEPFPTFLKPVQGVAFAKRGWLKIKKFRIFSSCSPSVTFMPSLFWSLNHLEIALAVNYSSSSNLTLLVTWGNGACWLWYKTSQRTCASRNAGALANRMSYCSLVLISAESRGQTWSSPWRSAGVTIFILHGFSHICFRVCLVCLEPKVKWGLRWDCVVILWINCMFFVINNNWCWNNLHINLSSQECIRARPLFQHYLFQEYIFLFIFPKRIWKCFFKNAKIYVYTHPSQKRPDHRS